MENNAETFRFEFVESEPSVGDLYNFKERLYPNLDIKIASSKVGTVMVEKNYSHKSLYGVTISANIDGSIEGSVPFHYLREDDANILRAELKNDAEKQFSDFLEKAKNFGLKPIGSIQTTPKKQYIETFIKTHGKNLKWYALEGFASGAVFPFAPVVGISTLFLTLPTFLQFQGEYRIWRERQTFVSLEEDLDKVSDRELRNQFEKAYYQPLLTNDMGMKEILSIAKEGFLEGFSILGKKLGITK